jgi:predicted Ser/Thr protein kinase
VGRLVAAPSSGTCVIMENPDAATVAQQALKLGLITEDQLQQGWHEVGGRGGEAEPLLLALERKGFLTPLQSQKLLRGDPGGYMLGGYRILYKIASGSFGRVYRGDDPQTGKVVAIKILRRKWSEDPHNIQLFEREGKVGLALRHPNIVEILAVSQDPVTEQYYIVMEFVEGGNLRELLRIRKKLEPREVLRVLEDAANGLAYVASRGISHRDMKLTNILLASQGTAKLVDFGLAGMERRVHKVEGPAPKKAKDKDEDGQVDRTVDYAGLEKATGVPHGDIRSDIFFLGCVAYELLTGRPPLESTRDARRRMSRERFIAVKPMTPAEVQAPPSVFRLVETMMALEPLKRFQTPGQTLEAIREVRRELEGTATREGAAAVRSVFIVEREQHLQDALRGKFKEMGHRVLLAVDPRRALDRFRQQPYQALIIDARTVGEDGIYVFDVVVKEAARQGLPLAGVLLVSEEQQGQAEKLSSQSAAGVLVGAHVTMKQLLTEFARTMTAAFGNAAARPTPREPAGQPDKEVAT